MSTGALLLAAGASTRLGRPKQTVLLCGETLLDRAVRIAGEAGLWPVIVVLGAHAEEVRAGCRLARAQVVVHTGWAAGMGSTLAFGVRHLEAGVGNPAAAEGASEAAEGVVVMTCDMPAVTPAHLRALRASGRRTASFYAKRRGVPAYFPREDFAALCACSGETGARALLRGAAAQVELPGGAFDIDTPEDLQRLLSTGGVPAVR